MNDFVKMAQHITKFVSSVIPFPISLTDESGYIIGATDSSRVGELHPDAKKIIKTKSFVCYEVDEVSNLSNVHPGISAPLIFNEKIIGIIGIIGSPNKVQPYAKLIKQYVEYVWHLNYHQQLNDLESKMDEIYLQYLLHPEDSDSKKVIEYSHSLNIEPYQNMICIVIDIHDHIKNEIGNKTLSLSGHNLRDLIFDKVKIIFHYERLLKVSFINTETIIVIISFEFESQYKKFMKTFKSTCERLIHELEGSNIINARIASGKLINFIGELKQSYEEATFLLDCNRNGTIEGFVFSLSDWTIASKLLLVKIDSDFIQRIAGEFQHLSTDNQFSELKRSFTGYCDNNMNVSQASKSLFIHRNTLIYRLDKIETLFNIDTKNFQQCVLLYFMLSSNVFNNMNQFHKC